MKRIATALIFGSVLLLVPGLALCTEMADGRGGFRGIPWGTQVSGLQKSGLDEVPDARSQYGGITSYKRRKDEAVFAGIPVDNITYNFWRGRFYSVSMDVRGFISYERLLDFCDREFGPRVAFMGNGDETFAAYESKDTAYLLTFYVPRTSERRSAVNTGRFFLYSRELDRQMNGMGDGKNAAASVPVSSGKKSTAKPSTPVMTGMEGMPEMPPSSAGDAPMGTPMNRQPAENDPKADARPAAPPPVPASSVTVPEPPPSPPR